MFHSSLRRKQSDYLDEDEDSEMEYDEESGMQVMNTSNFREAEDEEEYDYLNQTRDEDAEYLDENADLPDW